MGTVLNRAGLLAGTKRAEQRDVNLPLATKQKSGTSWLKSVLIYQPELSRSVPEEPRSYLGAFIALLALYCVWVLSLPAFPTQDGPMHLYYVHALHQLANGNELFSNSYALRSPFPPYMVQYVILYALTSVMDSLWAEKIVVCLILIVTATGFRALASSLGKAGALVSLWIFPVILSWALFMGFHNFCLSLGFSLWAMAFWVLGAAGRKRYFLLFCCAVLLVEFTHPVPLLILICCLFVDLCVRIFNLQSAAGLSWKETAGKFRAELAVFGAAVSSLCYLRLFVNSNHVVTAFPMHVPITTWLRQLALLQYMCLGSGGISTKLYRLILGTAFLFFLSLSWRRFKSSWMHKQLEASSTMLICAAGVSLLLPLLPSRVNGLDYFRERLVIYVFLFAFASAGACRGLSLRARTILYMGALIAAGFNLAIAEKLTRPVASDVVQVESLVEGVHSKAGLLLDASRTIGSRRLTENPYNLWSGARFFRRSNVLLLNDPWAGPPNILPIDRSRGQRLNSQLSSFELLDPLKVRQELLQSGEARDRILSRTDLIFFVGLPQNEQLVDPLLAVSGRNWTCHQGNWFFYCEADPHATRTTISPLGSSLVEPHAEVAFKELKSTDKRYWGDE